MKNKKKILFVHQNFPAQYKHIAKKLVESNYEVHSLSLKAFEQDSRIKSHIYTINKNTSANINEWAVEFETKMIRAEAAAKKAKSIRDSGFYPDLLMIHPGWGENFFLKEIWPEAKVITYAEFYYKTSDCDIDFDIEFIENILKKEFKSYHEYNKFKLTARNAAYTHSYLNSDYLVCPTNFQKNVLPEIIQKNVNVIHDGIDTNFLKPNKNVKIKIREKNFTVNDKVITYISRSLDPYRGFHIFMQSLPEILKNNPDASVIIVGDETSHGYGAPHPDGIRFKELYYSKIKEKVDLDRIYFVGRVPYDIFIKIIQLTTVHIYLTYPFVLSWSLLEAMSCGALVIGSNTDPVKEVIKNKENGLLVDFFDHELLAKLVTKVLKDSNKFNDIRNNARNTIIENYDLETICLPKHLELIKEVLNEDRRS